MNKRQKIAERILDNEEIKNAVARRNKEQGDWVKVFHKQCGHAFFSIDDGSIHDFHRVVESFCRENVQHALRASLLLAPPNMRDEVLAQIAGDVHCLLKSGKFSDDDLDNIADNIIAEIRKQKNDGGLSEKEIADYLAKWDEEEN